MWLPALVLLTFLIYYFWARKYIFVNKGRTDIEKVNREFIVDQLGFPNNEILLDKNHTQFIYIFKRSTVLIEVPIYKYILKNIDVRTVETINKEEVSYKIFHIASLKEYMKQVKDYV